MNCAVLSSQYYKDKTMKFPSNDTQVSDLMKLSDAIGLYHRTISWIVLLQQTACLVVSPNMVGNFAFLFHCALVDRTSDSMTVLT